MLHPRGPLPPEIYWRRRALAVGVVAVVVIIILAIFVFGGGSKTPSAQNAVNSASASTSSVFVTPSTSINTGVPGQNGALPQAGGSGSATSSTTPTTSVSVNPGDVCPDQTLAVKAQPNQPAYKVGDQPKFTLTVTNIGTVACKRDLGAAVQQALVYTLADNQRIWSNIDCYPSTDTNIMSLNPGQQATSEIDWSGTGSSPGCPMPRPQIGAGSYQLVMQLGEIRSAPVPFNIA